MKFCVCKIVNTVQLRRAFYIAELHSLTPRHFVGFFDNRTKWCPVLDEFGTMLNTIGETKNHYLKNLRKSMEFGSYLFNELFFPVDCDEESTVIENAVDTFTWEYEPPSIIQLPVIFWDSVLLYGGAHPNLFITTEHVFHVVDNEDVYTYIWLPGKREPLELQLTGSVVDYLFSNPPSLEMIGHGSSIYTVVCPSDEGNYYLTYSLKAATFEFMFKHKRVPKKEGIPFVLSNELLSVRRQQPDEIIPVPVWKAS